MINSIKSIFDKISSIGVFERTIESQFIESTNRATLVAIFVTFPYIPTYIMIEDFKMTLVNTLFLFLYPLILLLNHKHYYLVGKMLLVILGYLHVLNVSVYYGNQTGFELYFYLMPIMSTFVFSRKEQKFMLIGIVLFFIFFFLTQYLYTVITPQSIEDDIAKLLYYSSILFVLIFIMSFVYFFRISSLHFQEGLEEQKIIAQKANKAKSSFLANMSHEIRTPLNAILGFIDLLKKRTEDKTSSGYLNIIDSSSKSLLNIIEDILDFSKIDSEKLEISKIDFDARSEFEVITYLFDARCSEKDITLILNIDENVPEYLHSDPHRLKQIISNLLSNAVKFTNEGKSIVVEISYKENLLNISVKDEGKGIAEDKQKQIFTAFGQEDSSTTREYGGTGLGLSISTQLVKLLGGELKLKSEVGKGSEFYFSILTEVGKEVVTEKITDDGSVLSGNILLVEDNKTNQMFMKIVLEELNLTFDIANDGLEAIEMFKDKKYDAILMDENMPNMGGMESSSKILEIEKQNSLVHTPIIALTANALKGDRDKFLSAGMDEYLTKPINQHILFQVLGKFLKANVK